MVIQVLPCSHCQGTDVVRHGTTRQATVSVPDMPGSMSSDVGKKAEPRWLWHAIDHHGGTVLAYVFGWRKDEAFLELQGLLEPFGITRFYMDGWGAYDQ